MVCSPSSPTENYGSNLINLKLSGVSMLTFKELGVHLFSFLYRSSKLCGGICFAKQGLLAGKEKCQSVHSLSFHLNGKRFSCFFYFLLSNTRVWWVFQDCGLGLT